ncbi:MAG: sodium:solute symporter, partial [Prevotellaceae bacterium]|nr:sodium:solute symporter [Prevotellaceae bacterium]
ASFSSADSALTSLTTSISVDILNVEKKEPELAKNTRLKVHVLVSILFGIIILVIDAFNKTNILDAIYTIASYTYGPLLGMFCFGLFTKRTITKDKYVPYICILSPVLCYFLSLLLQQAFNYKVGYELLMLNGLVTYTGLLCISSSNKKH